MKKLQMEARTKFVVTILTLLIPMEQGDSGESGQETRT